ncbi:hypothetical protein NliqN6_0514 [Naganishia liquefaciens]|uniref:Uncharacterized protein n=1 Tax=Naganishia liquefaciens TaxID=104408 RepID=A0A8H3TN50_9TREE|nr:hypothetical protein NliqN6_0514 [Naganishia liquefaciens]
MSQPSKESPDASSIPSGSLDGSSSVFDNSTKRSQTTGTCCDPKASEDGVPISDPPGSDKEGDMIAYFWDIYRRLDYGELDALALAKQEAARRYQLQVARISEKVNATNQAGEGSG